MHTEVVQSERQVRIEEPIIVMPRGFAGLNVFLTIRRMPEFLGLPAAAMIAAATIWAGAQLLGFNTDTVDLRIAPVMVAPQTGGPGKIFCRAPQPGAGTDGSAITDSAGWKFPLYACATGGIAGPAGPVTAASATDGRMLLETVGNHGAIYAVMMKNTASRGMPDASGAEFRDGYAFSPAFVAQSGLSITALSRRCEAGFAPAPRSLEDPAPYGAGQASYAPGTPSVTPKGGFVCGGTRIVDGDLNLPD